MTEFEQWLANTLQEVLYHLDKLESAKPPLVVQSPSRDKTNAKRELLLGIAGFVSAIPVLVVLHQLLP